MIADGAGSRARILVADDEPNIRRYVLDILEEVPNVEAYAVASGEEAIDALDNGPWDLVITDHRMGLTDGVTVLEAVASGSPATGRVMMTGYAEVPLVERAMNRGHVNRFLAKPFSVREFLDVVHGLLGDVRASRLRAGAFERAKRIADARAEEGA